VEALAQAFDACTLPPSRWTHAAHLAVALWSLRQFGRDGAAHFMRFGIRRYNVASGGHAQAYHETVTLAWLRLVAHFAESHAGLPLDEAAQLLVAELGDSRFLEKHYTRERLQSETARNGWLPPDLAPLP
jgi:hypothetical protein